MKDVLKFFSSVRLSVILLILLTVGSFIGTLVIKYDVYHSAPFRFLLGLFAINLIFCSLDRLPGVWKRLKDQNRNYARAFRRVPGVEDEILVDAPEAEAKSSAFQALRSFGGRVSETAMEGSTLLYSSRGAYSEFGPYLIHIAVLLILLGGYLGSGLGFKGNMTLYEGEASDTAVAQDGRHFIPLGFSVRCDDFSVEYYESGAPKDYRTRLAVLAEGGVVVDERMIEVNHPWFYRGIGFYQQSWGRDRTYRFRAASLEEGVTAGADISMGETFEIPDSGIVLMPVSDFSDMRDAGGEFEDALFVHVFFQNRMQGHLRLKEGEPKDALGYSVSYERGESRLWTGLEVVKDPGIPFVWSGFAIFCIGLVFSFATGYRRLWIRVRGEGAGSRIEFFGTARRNEAALRRRIGEMKDQLAAGSGKG